jgi:hypothetical protein
MFSLSSYHTKNKIISILKGRQYVADDQEYKSLMTVLAERAAEGTLGEKQAE